MASNAKISIDSGKNIKSYFDKWLLIDVIATFPYEYFLITIASNDEARYVLLLRLLKIGRLVEVLEIIRNNTRHSFSTLMFFINIIIFFYGCQHILACIYGYIGRRELTDIRYD